MVNHISLIWPQLRGFGSRVFRYGFQTNKIETSLQFDIVGRLRRLLEIFSLR